MVAVHRPGRVVVGIDLSLAALRALRVAVAEARYRGVALHAVRTWSPAPAEPDTGSLLRSESTYPPGGEAGGIGRAGQPTGDPEELAAAKVIAEAFSATLGGEPPDLEVHSVVIPDHPGRVLVDYACRDDDLLVLGAGRHRRLRRLPRSAVVRYCVTRATCPVLVVPPPPLARTGVSRALVRELHRELDQLAERPADQ